MELDILQSVQEGMGMTELDILQSIQDMGMTELEILQNIQDMVVRIVDMLWFLGGIGLGIALGWGLVKWMR